MYSYIGNGEQRFSEICQLYVRRERVFGAKDNLARQRQGSVQPAHVIDTAVTFRVQPDVAVLFHLRTGLDAKSGKIAVCCSDAEAVLCPGICTYRKSDEAGSIG